MLLLHRHLRFFLRQRHGVQMGARSHLVARSVQNSIETEKHAWLSQVEVLVEMRAAYLQELGKWSKYGPLTLIEIIKWESALASSASAPIPPSCQLDRIDIVWGVGRLFWVRIRPCYCCRIGVLVFENRHSTFPPQIAMIMQSWRQCGHSATC